VVVPSGARVGEELVPADLIPSKWTRPHDQTARPAGVNGSTVMPGWPAGPTAAARSRPNTVSTLASVARLTNCLTPSKANEPRPRGRNSVLSQRKAVPPVVSVANMAASSPFLTCAEAPALSDFGAAVEHRESAVRQDGDVPQVQVGITDQELGQGLDEGAATGSAARARRVESPIAKLAPSRA
jgi:hypothetical protein